MFITLNSKCFVFNDSQDFKNSDPKQSESESRPDLKAHPKLKSGTKKTKIELCFVG